MVRTVLPSRRGTWRQKVQIWNEDDGVKHTFYVDFGEYADGRLAEIFITCHRTGTFVRGILDTFAQVCSIALQSGVPAVELADVLKGQDFPPRGELTAVGSEIKICKSIVDYIGQEIEASYGGEGSGPKGRVPHSYHVSAG